MTLTANWTLSEIAIRQLANDNTQVEKAQFFRRGLPPSTIYDEAGIPVAVVHLHANLVRAIFASVIEKDHHADGPANTAMRDAVPRVPVHHKRDSASLWPR